MSVLRRVSFWIFFTPIIPAEALLSQNAPRLLRDTSTVRSYDGRTVVADLLQITVPEARARSGRMITIFAQRLPTTSLKPGDPIVFLMGGPGIPGTVMAPIPPYFSLFQRLRELGDVIIVDQRGLGRSEPVLDCPAEGGLSTDAFLRTETLVSAINRRVAACATHWRAQGADPSSYNTLESADDINDLRQSLGVEKIDIVAFSYGTRLALAVMQRHGTHVGRVVLQGVNGPGLVVKRPAPVARKLRYLSDLLRKDSTWDGSTDLLAATRSARARLDRAPVTVTVPDRRSGQPIRLQIGRAGFDAIVSLSLDDARLPALLSSVAAGDTSVLTRFVEAAWNGLNSGSVGLMARAVNCAADRPRARWRLVDKESATAPFGAPIDNAFLTNEFCGASGFRTSPVEFSRPLRSLIPVLMLTGTLDATNPIENARDVARGLPNAILLEIENAAHEALPVPAVQQVIIGFLSGADVRGQSLVAPVPRFIGIEEAARQSLPSRR